MAQNSTHSERKITRKITSDGARRTTFIEGPMGTRKTISDAEGNLSERYTKYPDGKWRHNFYNDGFKTTSVEFDGMTTTTIVLDKRGRVTAMSEE